MNAMPENKMLVSETEQIEVQLAKLADQRIGQDASDIVEHVIKNGDIDRIMTGCNLVNAFNFAIQQQAKREIWTSEDYRAFCIALAAMNAIK